MIFFFKKKPIIVECFTNEPQLLELAPIQKTQAFIPKWWKHLPSGFKHKANFFDTPTMKHCAGFVSWYTHGFTIPMWSDLDIVVGSKQEGGYRFQYADRRSHAIEHPSEQYNNVYPPNNFQHLKLVPPWMFLCNENIQFAFLEHTWNLLHFNSFRVLPGVINFKYQTAGNVNIMIPKTDSEQFIHIPFKEPLAQIIPLSDRPIKLVLHADKDKFDALDDKFNRQFRFVKQYLTSSKIRRNNERNE